MNEFSLTVSKTGGDVDLSLLDKVDDFIKEYAICGGVATEVGSRAHNLHLQGALSIRYPRDVNHVKKLVKYFKDAVIKPRLGYKIMLKPFQKGQNMCTMIGYITKDQGMGSFIMNSI